MAEFVVVRVEGGGAYLFHTTNVFDQSRSNDFGLIKVDNSVKNGKSKRKRKEVKLWHVSILQNSDCLFRFFRNNSFFHISNITCKEKKINNPKPIRRYVIESGEQGEH